VLEKNYFLPLASFSTLPKKSSLWEEYHPFTSARNVRVTQMSNESLQRFTTLVFTLEMKKKKHKIITFNISQSNPAFKRDKFRLTLMESYTKKNLHKKWQIHYK
jgi:hypothetical protein